MGHIGEGLKLIKHSSIFYSSEGGAYWGGAQIDKTLFHRPIVVRVGHIGEGLKLIKHSSIFL